MGAKISLFIEKNVNISRKDTDRDVIVVVHRTGKDINRKLKVNSIVREYRLGSEKTGKEQLLLNGLKGFWIK